MVAESRNDHLRNGVEGRPVDGTEIGRHGLIPFGESGMD